MANELTIYQSVIDDVKGIISSGMESAYNATNRAMVLTNWNIGRRIVEEEQQGKERAEYGEQIIEKLSKQLTLRYGRGFGPRYLRSFRKFYQVVDSYKIWKSRFPNLTWTHIYKSLRVDDPIAIRWYYEENNKEEKV